MEERAAVATSAGHFGTEYGLLCLERAMPDELMRGLGLLADVTAPFKAEALHCSGEEGGGKWLDVLTDPFLIAVSDILSLKTSSSQKNGLREEEQEGDDFVGWRRADLRRERLSSPHDGLELEVDETRESENGMEALRWLKADIKRIARIFAREVSSDARCKGVTAGRWEGEGEREEEEEEEEMIDITVKLELLRKGKCPRFHLDKVIKFNVLGLQLRLPMNAHNRGTVSPLTVDGWLLARYLRIV